MTNFEFSKLYSVLGKNLEDPEVESILNIIYRDYQDLFIIHEPQEEDIKTGNDYWKCYDSQKLGIVIEIVCDIVASISFSSGVFLFNESKEVPAYNYPLLGDMSLNTNQDEIRRIFGPPHKQGDFFDQYKIDGRITMGILYNMQNGWISTVSYGLTEIFSNPEKSPNRFSFIFMSLS